MAKVKSETKTIFEGEGLLNFDNLTLENEDEGIIDYEEILKRADGKLVKLSVVFTEGVNIPTVEEDWFLGREEEWWKIT